MALISISSVSMIANSRIETLAWHRFGAWKPGQLADRWLAIPVELGRGQASACGNTASAILLDAHAPGLDDQLGEGSRVDFRRFDSGC